jgi:hypothetical protein
MGSVVCAHCQGEWDHRAQKFSHAIDCSWVAAKAFVEEYDDLCGCNLMSFYSGICSRGTRGCDIKHIPTATPPLSDEME